MRIFKNRCRTIRETDVLVLKNVLASVAKFRRARHSGLCQRQSEFCRFATEKVNTYHAKLLSGTVRNVLERRIKSKGVFSNKRVGHGVQLSY